MEKNQQSLFELEKNEEEWKKEWVGMPEFVQTKQEKPFAQIIFRFANEEDLEDFSRLIGQKLNKKTKSAWHPKMERGINANKIYVYEP